MPKSSLAKFKDALSELVHRFNRNYAHHKSAAFLEYSLRNDFLTPFWNVLGWDVQNEAGYTQKLREVDMESRVDDDGGPSKKVDYLFRTNGLNRFVCEAKKPHDDLKKGAYQAQRYAFNSQVRIAALSNFDCLQVFVIGGKPERKAPWAISKQWHFTEYLPAAQDIWDLFSRESVLNGSLEKYITSLPKRELPGRERQGWLIPPERVRTVDEEFLDFIKHKRKQLADALVEENAGHKWEPGTLNECIQRILDRILFVRICEDRDIDTGRTLERLVQDWKEITVNRPALYSRLVAHFNDLDETFNGALFEAGHVSEDLKVPDEFLVEIIAELSTEESPYDFATLPVEILGSVYEQFISHVVRFTRSGKPKIEPKPDVRKAGGVFYTPRYVVDYIVEEAVGVLLKGKSPREVQKLKIVDPACGSGSFLISAFERICQYYLQWFQKNPTERKERFCYCDEQGNLHLTTHLKRQVMLDNVYGVDYDPQAVEVTMLSLYLKILEGETRTTLGKQRTLFPKETFLPDLGDNVKCGNSIIGTDFVEQLELIGDNDDAEDALMLTNTFDWEEEFSNSTFDAVIGNPPWGAELTDEQREYLARKFANVVSRTVDTYIYFIAQAANLLSKSGYLGYIIPSTILNQVDATPVRKLLLKRGITHMINLGQSVFGSKVLNTSTILISAKKRNDERVIGDLSALPLESRREALVGLAPASWDGWKELVASDPHFTFFLTDRKSSRLLGRLRAKHGTLLDALSGPIQRGVSPDLTDAHVMNTETAAALEIEKELLKPSISGGQIHRYKPFKSDQVIIYTTRETDLREFPHTEAYLRQFKSKNTCPEVASRKHPWYALHRPRDPKIFTSPKIIGLTTAKTIELVFDERDGLFVTDAMYVFRPNKRTDTWALMAVMQSKPFLFLYRVANQGESRVIPQIKAAKLQPLPVPHLNPEHDETKRLSKYARQLFRVNQKLARAKSQKDKQSLTRLIKALERRVDEAVYALYGISNRDAAMVDEMFTTSVPVRRNSRERRGTTAQQTILALAD